MHLLRRNGTWYFRYVLPTTLVQQLQALEIKFTLNSYNKSYAKTVAAQCFARCCELPAKAFTSLAEAVEFVKAIPILMDNLTPLTTLLARPDTESLQHAFRLIDANSLPAYAKVQGLNEYAYFASKRNNANVYLPIRLDAHPDTIIVPYFDTQIALKSAFINDNTLITFTVPYTVHLHQLYVRDLPEGIVAKVRSITPAIASVASADKVPDSLKVSEEFAKFLDDKRPGWGKADTAHEYEYVIDRFIQIIGDLPVLTAMTNDNYTKFIQTIRKLPINLNTNPTLKGKSIDEIIAMGLPAMSDRTAQKYHTRCNAFIGWLKKFRYKTLHIHPTFVKAKEKVSAKKKRQRKPFNDEQLSIIFESEQSLSYLAKQRQPHKVWLPILALFLGNRLNEACQLKLSDVHDDADIPYITITDEETDQGVKADASMRDVPICSQLIQMGFLEYVRYLRTLPERKTHGQLFPDLKPRPDDQSNYGHQYSQFFGRFMDKLGITGKQYVFHSFRHTANMTLRRSGQDHVWIDIYLGWSKDDDESSEGVVSYMTDVKVDDLVQVAEAVTYPKLHLARYAELCRATYARKTYI